MALFLRNELHDAIVYLREGLPPGRIGGYRSLGFSMLAAALAKQGDQAEGLVALSQALQSAEETGEGMWNAELHRSWGLVLQSQNKLPDSEVAFLQALQLARQQQAKSWELRAATSLARLWGEQSRRAEARDLLAPVYGWFTEGFDTADLQEAKALLAQLA
jgi:predicted ATPase